MIISVFQRKELYKLPGELKRIWKKFYSEIGIEMVELKLKLAPKTEERLRAYVKKQFNTTLEKKLRDVLIEWIGKGIKNI